MEGLDPNRNTRYEFTNAALTRPTPGGADPDPRWSELNDTLKSLMEKLINHDAMRENAQQPYMTPAANKNQVYFVWDFVGRTLAMMYAVPPQLQASSQWSPAAEKIWSTEVVGRSALVACLISGETGGDPMMQIMRQSALPSQGEPQPEFGPEINQLANRLGNMRT